MKKGGLWVGGGVAIVLAAVLAWWNTGHSPEAPVVVSQSIQKEPHFVAGREDAREGRRTAPARPSLSRNTVTVLEGSVTAKGSNEPVKVRTLDGTTISAARLMKSDDGTILLSAPLQIESTAGGAITIEEGSATISPDGSFKTEGETMTTSRLKNP